MIAEYGPRAVWSGLLAIVAVMAAPKHLVYGSAWTGVGLLLFAVAAFYASTVWAGKAELSPACAECGRDRVGVSGRWCRVCELGMVAEAHGVR